MTISPVERRTLYDQCRTPRCCQEAVMCVRKILKCSHTLPVLCILVYFAWLFSARIHAGSNLRRIAGSEAADSNGRLHRSGNILNETRDIKRLYPGSYYRYCCVNGTWKRLRQETIPNPRRPYRIPHIIHQIWDTDKIPVRFLPWIRSWIEHHPNWEYWFWTTNDVRELIRKNYPKYLTTFNDYGSALMRADASRYFILHSFGGLYADLDTESLRPLDELVDRHACVLSEETYEHAHLLYFRNPPNLMTTIMACQPGHALFLVAIRALPYSQKRFRNRVLHSTGPFFFDSIYRYFLNQSVGVTDVKVLSPEYLLPTYDPGQSYQFDKVCSGLGARSPPYLNATCDGWNSERRLINRPTSRSYANHFWIHVTMRESYWRGMKSLPIESVLNAKPKSSKSVAARRRRSLMRKEEMFGLKRNPFIFENQI
ncbi:hypothetical protein LSH36_685g00026 [Paralvinella palmiformis]|uniref:Uncharacterized protein n=1 Tax=Paralvinella palmiformis TaxID=53620 RepID=A0AAD9MWB2_9ANNE|nr:hypothetical protein LSH36_685g00026 [Paralvinella palmiformis]